MIKTENDNKTFINSLKDFLYEKCLEGDKIEKGLVVGFSGGPDSTSLLHALSEILKQQKLVAVHVNYMLRGEESEEDQKFCETFCQELGIELLVFHVDIKAISKKKKKGIEECARDERYKIFEEIRVDKGLDFIAVGHNLEDQAETILLNVLRGSGIDGISGMWYRRGKLIRPLMMTRRKDIVDYCISNNFAVRIDSSNLSTEYDRNKIRVDLVPLLNQIMKRDISKQLVNLGENAKNDSKYLDKVAEREFKNICKSEIEEETNLPIIKIDAKQLLQLDYAIQLRLVRKAISKVASGLRDISYGQTQSVIALAKKLFSGKVVALASGAEAFYAYGEISIRRKERPPAKEKLEPKVLNLPGETEFAGKKLITTFVNKEEMKSEKKKKNVIFVDNRKVIGNLVVRNRRNGDIIYPFHSIGTKKLKDYLIDRKIPQDRRDSLVLVACDKEIVWFVGDTESGKYAAVDDSAEIMRIEVKD